MRVTTAGFRNYLQIEKLQKKIIEKGREDYERTRIKVENFRRLIPSTELGMLGTNLGLFKGPKIVLVGDVLKDRSFNGANKALPVLASALFNAGYRNVVQLDLERPDLSMSDVRYHAQNADLIVWSGTLTPQWLEIDKNTKELHDYLVSIGRGKEVPILVGGYGTAGHIEDIAEHTPWISGYCKGEGIHSIVSLADSIKRGTFQEDKQNGRLPGLSFWDSDRRVFVNRIAPNAEQGDWDQIDQNFGLVHIKAKHNMSIFTKDGRQLKTFQLFDQKGCPFNCGFCNKSTEEDKVVRVSEEAFRKQLRRAKLEGFEAVYLDVDTFSINLQKAKRIAQIIHEEGLVWGSNTRIDQVPKDEAKLREFLKFLVDNGCVYMFFGVEHELPEVAAASGKFNAGNGSDNSPKSALERARQQLQQAQSYSEKVERVFRIMSEEGIKLPSSYFTILGLPKLVLDESGAPIARDSSVAALQQEPLYTPTTFQDDITTIIVGLKRNPDYLNFNMLRFMPGSLAADQVGNHAYTCIRPSGEAPITAGWFLPRIAEIKGYSMTDNNEVFRLTESVGRNQPTTTAMTDASLKVTENERVYDTIGAAIALINRKISEEGHKTELFIDNDILELGLVRRHSDGRYWMAPSKFFKLLSDPSNQKLFLELENLEVNYDRFTQEFMNLIPRECFNLAELVANSRLNGN